MTPMNNIKNKIMRKVKCKLIFHARYKEIDMGIFESISKAKEYVMGCWERPYTIIKLNK